MRERPIIFSAPMVRAILDGRKTQTRRVVKPQPVMYAGPVTLHQTATVKATGMPEFTARGADGRAVYAFADGPHAVKAEVVSPFAVGQRLWVREAWNREGGSLSYRADGDWIADFKATNQSSRPDLRWRPSIHMPRWASRITLEVTDVRVQRLCDISEGDARAEGTPGRPDEIDGPMVSLAFARLWGSIHGEGAWAANPLVWAITFKRVDGGAS